MHQSGSPQQNRNGAGIKSGKRAQFFTLYWYPVHGFEALIEVSGAMNPRPG
jgi:hypothetical protein